MTMEHPVQQPFFPPNARKQSIKLLQAIAHRLLSHLLTGKTPPPLKVEKVPLFDLTENNRWDEKNDGLLKKILRDSPPHSLKPRLTGWITSRFGGFPHGGVPDIMWRVAGEAAFQDLKFQFSVCNTLQSYLWETVLLTQGDRVVTGLSSNTFWAWMVLADIHITEAATAAMTQAERKPALCCYCESRRLPALRRLIHFLKKEGERQVMTPEWAGFWDQWTVMKAMEANHNWEQRCRPEVTQSLSALPVVRAVRSCKKPAASETKETAASQPLSRQSWEKERPEWFLKLFRY